MSKTMAKRLKRAERQAAGMEKELRYLRENRVRYAQALREAGGELRTLRAVLAVLAGEGVALPRKEILKADGSKLRSALAEDGDTLKIWAER